MIVKTFIEVILDLENKFTDWCEKNKDAPEYATKLYEINYRILILSQFYLRPLSIEMLVNRVRFPEYEAWTGTEEGFNDAIREWLRREGKILFKKFEDGQPIMEVFYDRNPGTINDFISDCSRKEIELDWKDDIDIINTYLKPGYE